MKYREKKTGDVVEAAKGLSWNTVRLPEHWVVSRVGRIEIEVYNEADFLRLFEPVTYNAMVASWGPYGGGFTYQWRASRTKDGYAVTNALTGAQFILPVAAVEAIESVRRQEQRAAEYPKSDCTIHRG